MISVEQLEEAIDTPHNESLFRADNELQRDNRFYAILFGIISLKETTVEPEDES